MQKCSIFSRPVCWRVQGNSCLHTLARQVLNRSDGSHLRISCRLADPLALSSNPGRVIMMPRTTCTAERTLIYVLLCRQLALRGGRWAVSWLKEDMPRWVLANNTTRCGRALLASFHLLCVQTLHQAATRPPIAAPIRAPPVQPTCSTIVFTASVKHMVMAPPSSLTRPRNR